MSDGEADMFNLLESLSTSTWESSTTPESESSVLTSTCAVWSTRKLHEHESNLYGLCRSSWVALVDVSRGESTARLALAHPTR